MTISSICQRKGQDWVAQVAGQGWEAIVMADGISAMYEAGWAAKFAVNALIERIKQANGVFTANLFRTAFGEIPEKMRAQLPQDFSDLTEPQLHYGFGTTLLCAVRHGETYWFAYVGNGGIIHLRSRYFHQKSFNYPIPWSAVNLLNPHTIEEDGQEQLYRYISPRRSDTLAIPTVLCLSEQPNPSDYFILCTDGIFSTDHIPYTADDENGIWLKHELRLTRLYELLKDNRQPTQANIDTYLATLDEQNLLDDDATISILWQI